MPKLKLQLEGVTVNKRKVNGKLLFTTFGATHPNAENNQPLQEKILAVAIGNKFVWKHAVCT